MRLEEFDDEKAWWNTRQESEQSWKVSADEIAKNNYNLDLKNPIAPIENHEDPDELLRRYQDSILRVQKLQELLKVKLGESLEK